MNSSKTAWTHCDPDDLVPLMILNDYYTKPVQVYDLKEHFKSLKQVFMGLSGGELAQISNLVPPAVLKLAHTDTLSETVQKYFCHVKNLELAGVEIITIFDENYPEILRVQKNPRDTPLVLYRKGNLSSFERCIAISGSRETSEDGLRVAYAFATSLAKEGYTVVSGLAKGTDTMAHRGAIDAAGKTIAVLPCNISDIYPKVNVDLAHQIEKTGALISRFSPEVKLEKYHFIDRNRIISGISDCVVAIESDGTGGTARQIEIALSQGVTAFTVMPPKGNDVARRGFEKFVKLGARPVSDESELLRVLKERKKNKVRAEK